MPVRDPLGATAAALGRANGPREGARSAGWREVEEVERLEGGREGGGGGGCWAPSPPKVSGPRLTDGRPPHWVAVATRSVVRLIRGVDSAAKIKRHCGR